MHAYMLSHFSRVQVCATLWTVSYQNLLSVGFSRQEYWSGLPSLPPKDLSNLGIQSRSPALQANSLPAELPGKSLGLGTMHLTLMTVL